MRQAVYLAGLAVIFSLAASPAFAGSAVPEIDGGSVAGGLGLLAGGVLLARARFQRK